MATPTTSMTQQKIPSRTHVLLATAIALGTNTLPQCGVAAFAPATRRAAAPRRRRATTNLYNLLDAMGEMMGVGTKLEPETKLPYDPPFCSETSVCGDVRTFAITERP